MRNQWLEPPRAKYLVKVHVCIFLRHHGYTIFIEGILRPHLLPFINNVFSDNDQKDTSKLNKTFHEPAGIKWWPTPPENPDLNPIELVWHKLKHYLRKTCKPARKEELIDGIKTFWATRMTKDKCNRYIDHLKKVVPKVIEREGHAYLDINLKITVRTD